MLHRAYWIWLVFCEENYVRNFDRSRASVLELMLYTILERHYCTRISEGTHERQHECQSRGNLLEELLRTFNRVQIHFRNTCYPLLFVLACYILNSSAEAHRPGVRIFRGVQSQGVALSTYQMACQALDQ